MGSNYDPGGRIRYNRAITDVYDEQRRTFLVQYPIWLVITLVLSGVIAFALTGFLGYTNQFPDSLFRQPWLLFLWLCALLIILQTSIFRYPSLRQRLVNVLVVSLLAIILVGVMYFSQSLPATLNQFLRGGQFLHVLASSPWTYAVVNFALIGVFWLDTIRRWLRRSRGLSPRPVVDIGVVGGPSDNDDMPALQELISGDLIAGGVLTLFLALLFQPQIVALLLHPSGITIDTCAISWPFGICAPGGAGIHNPPTLSYIDLIQALLYLPLGVMILVLSATISGLGALGGVSETYYDESRVMRQRNTATSANAVSEQVSLTVINTLRSALARRQRLLVANFALTLRNVIWPALIVLAIFGLAQLSSDVQIYLHGPRTLADIALYGLPALVSGVVAALAVTFSAALMLFRWRVAANTLRFMGLIAYILVLIYWIFSLGLTGINFLAIAIQLTARSPFIPPGASTFGSFAVLVATGITLVVRRGSVAGGARPQQVSAIIRDKELSNDFDVLLLYDQQDAPYMMRRVVQRLRNHSLLPFQGEVGVAALPSADQVRSAVICLGKHGAAFTRQQGVVSLLTAMATHQIPVAIAVFPGFRGGIPPALRALPQVNLKRPLANVVTGLEPIVGKADPEENQTYSVRIETVRQGLMDEASLAHPEFALALLNLMGIKELKPVNSRDFRSAEVWTGHLPHMGLQLPTGQMTIFLRADTPPRKYQAVLDKRQKDGAVLVVDIAEMQHRPMLQALAPVWIQLSDLKELVSMNPINLTRSVKRLITQQINEGLYPYKTHGVGVLFFGREEELKRLSGDHSRGGIIIGAHHSGKTNLLHKLKEDLSNHQRVVLGPMSSTSHEEFFDNVQRTLETLPQGRGAGITHLLGRDERLTMNNFDSILRRLGDQVGRVSFLIDEIDTLLEADEERGMRLTRIMRSLTLDEQADFYLAGHSRLRKAIARQESPLRNFATEIILTGLDEPSALRLIQEPMEQLGYTVTTEQARRIYRGTAGVAWLIQHFCLSLLHLGENHIDDAMLQKIEQNASFLQTVWDYFEYGLDSVSLAILMMTALQPDVERPQLMAHFAEHAVEISRTSLDDHLDFLVKFGVLQEDPPRFYHILALYLQSALLARDPETLMLDYLAKTRSVSI